MENQTSENLFKSAVKNYQKGNLKLATKICHKILEIERENSRSLNLLGVIAGLEEQPKEAISYLIQAVKLNPNNPEIHSNLGLALKDNQQYKAAIKHYQKALELKPNYAEPYNGLGSIFLELGKLAQSQKYYQEALKLDKNHVNAHFSLASILLKQGNFIQGFSEYEWRWQKKDISCRNFSQPLWDGSNFQGKTLLVYTEQGLGDSIQFIRYIPLVKKLGGSVIVELNQAGLNLLFTTVSGIDELFIRGESLPDFHWRIPLMSLPRILGTTLETIPAKIPYLSAPKLTNFPIPIAPEKNLKVGICWQTSSNAKTSQKRSYPVQYLEEILSIDKANFYILQKEVLPADLEWLKSQTKIHNLGLSFKNLGDTAAAIQQLDLVITIDTVIAHLAGALGKPVWILLPFVSDWRWMLDRNDSPWYPTARLFRQGKIGDWDSVFIEVKQALIQFQESPENLFKTAVKNYQKGNLKLATKICQKILETEPENSRSLHLLGVIAGLEGQPKEAVSYLTQAVQLNPNHPEIHSNLGLALKDNQQYKAAIKHYQKALELKLDYAEPYNGLGNIFLERGKFEAAIKHYQKALELKPNYAEPYNGLGNIFLERGKFEAAIKHYQKALELKPNYAEPYNGLGNIFLEQGKFEAAIKHYQKALELKPNYAEPYNGLGNIFLEGGRLVESQKYYQQALKLDKNHANAHFGLAVILLKQGNFIQGFNEYEWRWKKKDVSSCNFSQPLWDGSNFQGKTLLVYTEQGLGDSIQFIRYIPLVKKLGGRVIVKLNQGRLKLLFTIVSGIDELFIRGESLPDFHWRIPLMSLPRILGTTRETIPAKIPYLSVPKSTDFSMPSAPEKNLKVGICWQTSSNAKTSKKRSCPVEYLEGILSIGKVNFYILQKEVLPADLEWLNSQTEIHNLGSSFNDLADTAAAIQQLDLVITIDTVIAHLAGALGKPVWVILNFDSDWRWMLDRNDSPWYPTARLFRQGKIGDWDSVFIEVKQALIQFQESPENLFKTAVKNYQKGNLKLATKICHKILETEPKNSRSLHLLGVIAGLEGQPKEAIAYLTQAVKLNPNNPEIHSNFGLALKNNQQYEPAIKHYQKALELKPNYAKPYKGLGNIFLELGKFEVAIENYQKALELKPNYVEPYNGLGNIFLELGRLVESQQYYQQALKLDKNHANAHFGLAVILLKQGNFIQGFNEYEWRWKKKDVSSCNFSQPLWDGSNFQGKTLLVYTEQGLGDSIQFIRYIPLVKKLGGRVIVELNQGRLKLLFTIVSGIDELFIRGESLPDFHWRIPLMSLPRIFGTTLETIPAKIPYLSVPKSTDFSMASAPEKNLKVGICWQTSSNAKTSKKRSCPVEYLEGILSIGKVNFYILQKEVLPADLEWLNSQTEIHNLGSSFNDLADTAAAIQQLDLVITIDTVIAHLAGALGKPVWVILSFDSDWRWMLDRNDSPWYPTARLFRQGKIGDWDSVFIELKQAVIEFL